MRALLALLALLAYPIVSANLTFAQPCGDLLLTADGTWEFGYSWGGGDAPPPEYGAFAECYSGEGEVCGMALWVTHFEFGEQAPFDAFVWSDDGEGAPGSVLCASLGHNASPVPTWPNFERVDVPIEGCCVSGTWWIGFRGTWPGAPGMEILADIDGPVRGCPRTKIAPGLPYPEGWQDVSLIYGHDTKALAIGALFRSCAPTGTVTTTWGRVKS
ncbi:MAG: hypothetical protein IT349_21615, partial [Candidatus Eisenbacteria bacterium]|nr:hypothetical protein [Candidatus Eisenbacteria bacterium]